MDQTQYSPPIVQQGHGLLNPGTPPSTNFKMYFYRVVSQIGCVTFRTNQTGAIQTHLVCASQSLSN